MTRLDGGLALCGIELRRFARDPTPSELGAIVARMDSIEQSAFLCSLMEQIKFTCPVGRDVFQLSYIADALMGAANELGRDFVCDVADAIRHAEPYPAPHSRGGVGA